MRRTAFSFKRLAQIRRTIQIIWVSGPLWLILDIAMVFIQSAPPLILIALTKILIDRVTVNLGQQSFSDELFFANVLPVIIAILVTMLIISGTKNLSNYITMVQTQKVTAYIRDMIHRKSTELDLEFFENPEYQDIMYLAREQAPTRLNAIVGSIVDMGQGIISALAIVGLLIALNNLMIAGLIIAVIPGMLLRFYISREDFRWRQEHIHEYRLLGYLDHLLINISPVKEVRLFGIGRTVIENYNKVRDGLDAALRKKRRLTNAVDFLVDASGIIPVVGSYAYIVYLTTQNRLTIGDMVMYYQLFQRAQQVLQRLVNNLTNIYDSSLYSDAVYQFLDFQNNMPRSLLESAPVFPTPLKQGICFQDVSFQYPGSPRPTIEHINLEIHPGEVVALVGANGAGKTTLIKLLCRLYDPAAGQITVDGIDMRDFAIEDVRRNIGVIFQDYLGYQLSARENIHFGDITAPGHPEQIQAAAKVAGIHEKLSGLKFGYETHLGRWLQDGEELSGGEWQKVALARLFFRAAPIVVLDEPTSSLDARAEYNLFLKFREVIQGKTAILISHRLSTVRMADRIIVLENGRIAEIGTHEELISHNHTYAHLYRIQAQYYEE